MISALSKTASTASVSSAGNRDVRKQVERGAAVQRRERHPVDGIGKHVPVVAADVAQAA
ncbi:MAG: hypothetical protein ACRDTJ_04585 [Pseudonocardiaceae bacterium]